MGTTTKQVCTLVGTSVSMKIIILLFASFSLLFSHAQKTTPEQFKQLKQVEAEIKNNSRTMIMADEAVDRYRADSFFTRGLVKALRIPNSFYYPFDSILTVSKIYSPDSVFRIFTWQLTKDLSSLRQKGAIQMRTDDGSLKLIPLIDNSDDTNNPVDSARSSKRWIGAIYYKVILKTFNNKNFYTLLGFDDNDEKSNKKWIEVMTFDTKGEPVFGGRFFQYPNDELKPPQPAFRFCLEYKKDGRARMNYDAEMDAIIFDHLISEDKTPAKKNTLIPDGDYEAFKWNSGRWVHVNKVFDYKADMQGVDPMLGNPPVPAPLPEKKEEQEPQKRKKGDHKPSSYRVDDKNKKKEDPRKKEEY